MKSLISLILLVQVGSNLYINPDYVVGATAGEMVSTCSNGTTIFTQAGIETVASSYVCSDWDLNKVLDALKEAK